MVLHYYFRFKVSLDDVVELMAMRNIYLSHQTVSNWIQLCGTQLEMKLRFRRHGKSSSKWHIDAAYLKIGGHWCYLYRSIDKEGNLFARVTHYKTEKLRCDLCGYYVSAVLPANVSPDMYDAAFKAQLCLMKYYLINCLAHARRSTPRSAYQLRGESPLPETSLKVLGIES